MSSLDIIVAVPSGAGWVPVHAMAELLARYTGGTVHTVDVGASLSKETKLLARLPRLKGGSKRCLVIASDPGQLYAISQRSFAFRRYGAIYGWVIDSFWDDRIPAVAKSSTYDRILVADVDDIQPWTAAGVKAPGVLPWGADVWSKFSDRLAALESKSTDLLRVGRQPAAYEDDEATAALAGELGLSFKGRPPFGANDRESAQHLQDSLNRAKFLLAFSTSVSPAPYTHPTKEYITGRWTDALASGVTVVGKVPNTTTVREILWDGATIDIDHADARTGLAQVADAVSRWTPAQGELQIRQALQHLDWRHRFVQLCEAMGEVPASLAADCEAMHAQYVQR